MFAPEFVAWRLLGIVGVVELLGRAAAAVRSEATMGYLPPAIGHFGRRSPVWSELIILEGGGGDGPEPACRPTDAGGSPRAGRLEDHSGDTHSRGQPQRAPRRLRPVRSEIIKATRGHTNFHSTRRGECGLCEAWIFYVQVVLGEPDRARAQRLEWLV